MNKCSKCGGAYSTDRPHQCSQRIEGLRETIKQAQQSIAEPEDTTRLEDGTRVYHFGREPEGKG